MATLADDAPVQTPERGRAGGAYARFARFLRRQMPTGLFARSLIIIITPIVILQAVVAFVFMERHWEMVTRRLSAAVVQDVAALVDVLGTYPQDAEYAELQRIALEDMRLVVRVLPPEPLPAPAPKPFIALLDLVLSQELRQRVGLPFWIDTVSRPNAVEIRIRLPEHVFQVFVARGQTYASNSHIFILWMVGTSLVLLTIAIAFLRNQIRPILTIAAAADDFGKGRPVRPFKIRGAREVRQAGHAFGSMRARIERQIEQRTTMLAGVSHDLRTVLTRFRLQLALLEESNDVEALRRDIDDMNRMLEGYLAFARGDAGESTARIDVAAMLDTLAAENALDGPAVPVTYAGERFALVRPLAFKRCLTNLILNARRHARSRVTVSADHSAGCLTIHVDDDGPGIAIEERDAVFRPFYRLDAARNLDQSGTGLGLAIARDVVRVHGGEIKLDDSPLGGLRVTVTIPG